MTPRSVGREHRSASQTPAPGIDTSRESIQSWVDACKSLPLTLSITAWLSGIPRKKVDVGVSPISSHLKISIFIVYIPF